MQYTTPTRGKTKLTDTTLVFLRAKRMMLSCTLKWGTSSLKQHQQSCLRLQEVCSCGQAGGGRTVSCQPLGVLGSWHMILGATLLSHPQVSQVSRMQVKVTSKKWTDMSQRKTGRWPVGHEKVLSISLTLGKSRSQWQWGSHFSTVCYSVLDPLGPRSLF